MGLWTPQLLCGETPSALIGVKRESPERNPHPPTPEFRLRSNSCSLKSLPGPPNREWENVLPGNAARTGTQLPSLTALELLPVGLVFLSQWVVREGQPRQLVVSGPESGQGQRPRGTLADPGCKASLTRRSPPLGPMDPALPRQTPPLQVLEASRRATLEWGPL